MELTDRRRKILRAVVDSYIQTAEPVGSKAISSMPDVGFSSATIRNEMSELEAMGLLEQPHTSAGRIPSAAGYRLYVDELMQDYRLTIDDTARLNDALRMKMVELDKVVSEAGKVVSKLTNYPAYTLTSRNDPNVAVRRFELILVDELSVIIIVMSTGDIIKNKLIKSPEIYSDSDIKLLTAVLNSGLTDITPERFTPELLGKIERNSGPAAKLLPYVVEFALEVLSEEREGLLYVTGETKLLTHPEYHDLDKAQRVIDSLSTRELAALLPEASEDDPVKILIGPENISEALKDTSVVVARYDIGGGMHGMIGVVGPTRMDYAKVAARLSYFAEGLNKLFHPQSSLIEASEDNTNDDGGNHGQE